VDFSKVPISIGIENPHWLYRNQNQQLMQYNGFYQTCMLGEYQQKLSLQILREIFDTFAFDGLYCNMMGYQSRDYSHHEWGPCHCTSCKRAFAQYTDRPIPTDTNLDDPTFHVYQRFKEEQLVLHRAKIGALLDEYEDRELCFDGRDYDRREAAGELNRRVQEFIYHSSSNCRTKHAGRIVSNAMVDFPGYARRHSSVSPHTARIRLLQSIAHGGALDYYQIGRLDNRADRLAHKAVKETFALAKRHHQFLKGLQMEAHVLLRRNNGWSFTAEEQGWITLLSEHHLLFEEATQEKLLGLDLASYSLIILPDSINLDEREAALIDAYVEQGGTVLATAGAGMYDEREGLCRQPLLDCLGIAEVHKRRSCDQSALYWICEEEKVKLGLGLADVDILPAGELCYATTHARGAKGMLHFIADHTYGPPEWCAFDAVSLDVGMVENTYGKGKSLYMAWKAGQSFFTEASAALGLLAEGLLFDWAKLDSIAKSIPSCVEVSKGRTHDGKDVIFLVNLSGYRPPVTHKPLPINNVVLALPAGKKIKKVASTEESDILLTENDGHVEITVGHLDEWDAIIITYYVEEEIL
jgi:hypothetical protein